MADSAGMCSSDAPSFRARSPFPFWARGLDFSAGFQRDGTTDASCGNAVRPVTALSQGARTSDEEGRFGFARFHQYFDGNPEATCG